MKIRSGYVSNSSSSSFTCDVCGETESGMDASPHDFDMESCCNGHTFCMSHAEDLPDPTPDKLRASMESQIKGCTWSNDKAKAEQLAELAEVPDDNIEEYWRNEGFDDDGVPEYQCPICMLTTIDNGEGYAYLLKKQGLTKKSLVDVVKEEFKTYRTFREFIYPPKKD